MGKDRRIMWSWGHGYPREITDSTPSVGKYFSVLTLARELTWNPDLQLLQVYPIEEQQLLRGKELCNLTGVAMHQHQYFSLGNWEDGNGKRSEVMLEFELPTTNATFGVVVMGGTDLSTQGSYISVQYTPPEDQVAPYAVDIAVSVYGSIMKEFPDVTGKLWLLPTD